MDRLECFEHCSVGQAQILCKKTCCEVLTFKHQNTYPTCPICLRAYHPEQTRCSGIGSQPGSGTLENHLSAEGSGMIQSIVLNKHPIPSFPHSLIPIRKDNHWETGRVHAGCVQSKFSRAPVPQCHSPWELTSTVRFRMFNGHVWWPESKQQKWHALDTRTSLLQPRC